MSYPADHQFVNVYVKDGKRNYAAYNFGNEPLEMKFFDSNVLVAEPSGVTVK